MAFDLQVALSTLAPTLASMLGGPLAGAAVTALEGAFGLQPGAGKDEITQVMQSGNMTPDTMAAVRAADQHHAEVIAAQQLDLVKINADHVAAMAATDAADRDSARRLQTAAPSIWPGLLSGVTTTAVLGVIGAGIMQGHLPSDPTTVQLIGSLTTGWGAAMAYWLGTTRSSAEKNNLLAQSTPPTS